MKRQRRIKIKRISLTALNYSQVLKKMMFHYFQSLILMVNFQATITATKAQTSLKVAKRIRRDPEKYRLLIALN